MTLAALGVAAYTVCTVAVYVDHFASIPTFEEQQAQKRALRDYVESVRADHLINRVKKNYTRNVQQVEARRQQILDDLEVVYDTCANRGVLLYRCNSSETLVGIPRQYLADRYNIHIDTATYMFRYTRSFLPRRQRVGGHQGIPGVDHRGWRLNDRGI
jgi:hypothetical protein